MKKAYSIALVCLTVLFLFITAGFYIWKNLPSPLDPPEVMSPVHTVSQNRLVDINTAGLEQLMTLPGVGEVLANRILNYRDSNGPFSTIGQLLEVEGLGSGKLEAILDYITIGGSHENSGS